ncbi:hypothetical protein [Rufibacter tibetensis]|nr:hypothetical protein [Rufibacter tibetensis]
MPESEVKAEKETPVSTSKIDSSGDLPPLPDQKPIAPSHARVVLEVVKILPDLAPAGNGPCSQAPCKTQVLISRVIGYGSGFNQTLEEGKQVRAHFPMSVKAGGGRPEITAGKKITADVRGSLSENDPLMVRSYSLLD